MVFFNDMNLKGKKIIVMGLGLHGGGSAVAWWLYTQGAHVLVTDLKPSSELRDALAQLESRCGEYAAIHSSGEYINIDYVLGRHRDEDFASADMIVQNPAVPRESRYLEIARHNAVSIENETSLFFLAAPHTSKAGITGTRGKSTTASMLNAMIRERDPRAALTSVALPSGSMSPCAALPFVMEAEMIENPLPVIMELSSWQLECLAPHHMSPSLSIMTNISPDHLNRYVGMNEYVEAKKTIYRYQQPSEPCIFNYDNEWTRRCAGEKDALGRFFFSRLVDHGEKGSFLAPSRSQSGVQAFWMRFCDGLLREVALTPDLALKGDHNIENALAAIAAASLWDIKEEQIRSVLRSFRGVAGRLQWYATVRGRDFYNDTAATSPHGTLVALKTLSQLGRRIILIAGGSDKGLDFEPLTHVAHMVAHCILFEGSALQKLEVALRISCEGPIDHVSNMGDALACAWRSSRAGDIILLSPAAASFGIFINEFDRGRQFERGIEDLKKQS